VVAEFAVAMPAVLLVLAMALGGVQVAGLQLRLQDAAADAARAWGRGDSTSSVTARVAVQVPGARAGRSMRGELVCATISAAPSGFAARFGIRVSATACAMAGGR
jgi:Flp pilus assembly protein TadG